MIDDSSIPPSRQQILIEQLFDQSGVGSMARGQGGGTLKDTCRELVPQCYKSWSQLHIRIAWEFLRYESWGPSSDTLVSLFWRGSQAPGFFKAHQVFAYVSPAEKPCSGTELLTWALSAFGLHQSICGNSLWCSVHQLPVAALSSWVKAPMSPGIFRKSRVEQKPVLPADPTWGSLL